VSYPSIFLCGRFFLVPYPSLMSILFLPRGQLSPPLINFPAILLSPPIHTSDSFLQLFRPFFLQVFFRLFFGPSAVSVNIRLRLPPLIFHHPSLPFYYDSERPKRDKVILLDLVFPLPPLFQEVQVVPPQRLSMRQTKAPIRGLWHLPLSLSILGHLWLCELWV